MNISIICVVLTYLKASGPAGQLGEYSNKFEFVRLGRSHPSYAATALIQGRDSAGHNHCEIDQNHVGENNTVFINRYFD